MKKLRRFRTIEDAGAVDTAIVPTAELNALEQRLQDAEAEADANRREVAAVRLRDIEYEKVKRLRENQRHLQARNQRLVAALHDIASGEHCLTPGCDEDNPCCDVMTARAALSESEPPQSDDDAARTRLPDWGKVESGAYDGSPAWRANVTLGLYELRQRIEALEGHKHDAEIRPTTLRFRTGPPVKENDDE